MVEEAAVLEGPVEDDLGKVHAEDAVDAPGAAHHAVVPAVEGHKGEGRAHLG